MNSKRNKPWKGTVGPEWSIGLHVQPYLKQPGQLFFIPVIKYLTRGNVRDEQFILAHDLGDGVRYGRQSVAADSSLAVGSCGLDLVQWSEEMGQEAICYEPQILAPRDPFPSDRVHILKVSQSHHNQGSQYSNACRRYFTLASQ